MSQFRDGSFGRLSSQDGGIPVYCKTVLTPDIFLGAGGLSVGSALVGVDMALDSRHALNSGVTIFCAVCLFLLCRPP